MIRLHRIGLVFVSLFVAFCVSSASAQDDPNEQLGLHAFSAYSGGDIDTINTFNGGMNLDIPLVSYPQRGGKLILDVGLHYTNVGMTTTYRCVIQGYNYYCYGLSTSLHGFGIIDRGLFNGSASAGTIAVNSKGQEIATTFATNVAGGNGSSHLALPLSSNATSTIFETTDASGFQFDVLPDTPAGYPNEFVLDPTGTNYTYNFATDLNYRTDTNGNQITYSATNGWVDSLGRVIPPIISGNYEVDTLYNEVAAYGTAATTAGCSGPLPISAAYTWTPPGPNGGTYPIKFCFVALSDFTFQSGTFNELQSVVLPDNTTWTFQYTTSPGTQSVSQVTFPAGGTLAYTWGGSALPSACNLQGYTYATYYSIATRTLNPNDGITPPSVWTYTYVPSTSSTPQETIISAPPSSGSTPDDSVHTFGLGNCYGSYETIGQYYQGSHTSGTLLKTVNTQYTSTALTGAFITVLNIKTPVDVVPTQSVTTWPNGQTSKTVYTYDQKFTFCYPEFALNPTTDEITSFIGGATVCGSGGSPASYGMLLTKADYDYGGTTLLRTTTTDFLALANASYLAANIVAARSSVSVTGSGPGSFTTYNYDETGSPSGVRGNLTSSHHWLNTTGAYVVTSSVYNSSGLVTSSTDGNGNQTTYAYSGGYAGSGPTSVTNPKLQTTTNTYDFNTGLLLSTVDPNNLSTSRTYDEMLRPLSLDYPDGGQTTFSYPSPTEVQISDAISEGAGGSLLQRTSTLLVDGLGRKVREIVTSGEPISYDQVDICYDGMGRTSFKSYGYQGSGLSVSKVCSGAGDSFQYDGLSRPTMVVHSDNSSVSTSYSGNSTTVTDEQAKVRQSFTDGLGRLEQVIENPGGLNYSTSYSYDALGNLTGVTQNGSRQRTFVYDSLSRLTSSTNPESNWSPSGASYVSTQYGYDGDNNLINKIEPAPNQQGASTVTLTYCYDALSRMTAKGYSNQTCSNGFLPTPAASYAYDGGSLPSGCTVGSFNFGFAIGRRTAMCDSGGTEAWGYNIVSGIGWQTIDQRTTNSVTKTAVYQDNFLREPASVQYPSGRTILYAYNGGGMPTSAQDGGTSVQYVTSAHYGADRKLCWAAIGGVATIAETFNGRLQPLGMQAISPLIAYPGSGCPGLGQTGNLLDLTYGFNYGSGDNGNVMAIANNRDSTRTQDFAYDALNRLLAANSSTYATSPSHCWGEAYVYDNNATGGAWGNLTNINSISSAYTGCTQESLSVTATAQNQITSGTSIGYDTAGNMMANSGSTYTYDAENHLTSTAGVNYTYDGDGKRVEKSNGKIYWYGLDGKVLDETDLTGSTTNSNFSEYVYFEGKRIAHISGVSGTPISIQNASFETTSGSLSPGGYNSGPIPSWTLSGSGGSWYPTSTYFSSIPNGNIVGYSNGGSISQSLAGTSLLPNSTYTLSAYVGNRLDGQSSNYSIQLEAGSSVLGTLSGSSSAISAGTFANQVLTYNTGASAPSGNLGVVLSSTGGGTQADFDQIQLSVSSTQSITYYLEDHLGTSRVMVDSAGNLCYDADFYPFGGERAYTNSCSQNYKFTGKERDTESGLDNFAARYDASYLARFMSSDPGPFVWSDPQSLNRYPYTRNNPLKHIDPTGKYFVVSTTDPHYSTFVAAIADMLMTPEGRALVYMIQHDPRPSFYRSGKIPQESGHIKAGATTALEDGVNHSIAGTDTVIDFGEVKAAHSKKKQISADGKVTIAHETYHVADDLAASSWTDAANRGVVADSEDAGGTVDGPAEHFGEEVESEVFDRSAMSKKSRTPDYVFAHFDVLFDYVDAYNRAMAEANKMLRDGGCRLIQESCQ